MQIFRPKKPKRDDSITQNIRGRYIDVTKLQRLLEELFGKGNFRIGVSAAYRTRGTTWLTIQPAEGRRVDFGSSTHSNRGKFPLFVDSVTPLTGQPIGRT
jgi:hypothetical protein